MAPSKSLHPPIKHWPFTVRDIDLIGKIYIGSFTRHTFIIVAFVYFTKRVEVQPMINVGKNEIIDFTLHPIIYMFGILDTITIDLGMMSIDDKVVAFMQMFGIKLTIFYRVLLTGASGALAKESKNNFFVLEI